MSQNPKAAVSAEKKIDRLRRLRLADETARKEAGTWGDVTVGEIFHTASQTVYVQVWKGFRRPNPLGAANAQIAGVSPEDWLAIKAWLEAEKSTGFSQRVIGSRLSATAARQVKLDCMTQNLTEGRTVINRDAPRMESATA